MLASQDFHLSDPRFFIPWRLSGLLSGYLPTDTRPQARAKLGNSANSRFEFVAQEFFCPEHKFPNACLQARFARGVESEQALSFFNAAGFCGGHRGSARRELTRGA
jgi:hypothetical protein